MSTWAYRVRVFGFSVAAGLALAAGASAVVVFNVNSTLDQVDDDVFDGVCHTAANTCTLRAAVMQANLITLGTRIVLPAGIYTLTIPEAGADGPESGDLDLTTPTGGSPEMIITGAGQSFSIIEAAPFQQSRIFKILPGRFASLRGLTLRNGNVVWVGQHGGAIWNTGVASLHYCTVSGNTVADGNGAGIANFGNLFVFDSKISGNSAGREGGGIFNIVSAQIWRTAITGNLAFTKGGGISSWSTLDVTESTISMNTSHADGGGIYNEEPLTLINTTIYGNSADGNGGGIYFEAYRPEFHVNVFNSTIAGNGADADADADGGNGGGIYVTPGSGFHIRNTLLADNYLRNAPIYDDCWGTVNSYGRSLFWEPGDACSIVVQSGSAWILNSLAALGPLRVDGGPTATIALLAGSNAIDGGDPGDGCIGPNLEPLAYDQRGATRRAGARCDVGAFEYGALPAGTIFSDGFELGNLWGWGGG